MLKKILKSIGIATVAIGMTAGIVSAASVFFPYQGGTGTSTVPAAGRLLVGTGSIYAPTSTVSATTTFTKTLILPWASQGSMFYVSDASGTLTQVPSNTVTTTLKFLSQFGNNMPTWQTVPNAGTYTYYLLNSSSTTGTTYKELGTATTSAMVSATFPSATGSSTIRQWITATGTPSLTTIPAGLWLLHMDATRTTQPNASTLNLYADVYKYNGTETLLFSSQQSAPITETNVNNPQEVDLETVQPSYSLAVGDRIVVRWYAVRNGPEAVAGAIYYQGITVSRLEFPSAIIDSTNFVPYTGATTNVDLGTNSLTASALTVTGVSNFNGITNSGTATTTNLTVNTSTKLGTLNGILKGTSGVVGTATAGVDYQAPITFPLGYASTTHVTVAAGTNITVSTSNGTSTINTTTTPSFTSVKLTGDNNTSLYGIKKLCDWSVSFTTSTQTWYDNMCILGASSTISSIFYVNKSTTDTITWNVYYGSSGSATTTSKYKVFSADQTVTSTPSSVVVSPSASSTPNRGDVLMLQSTNASSSMFTISIYGTDR